MSIHIPFHLYLKLFAYIQNCKNEISGLGKVQLKGDEIHVTDIRIFEQTVSGAETVLDAGALGKFYNEIIKEQGASEMVNWKIWWHSHAAMRTFWSGVDVTTIDNFDNQMDSHNWYLSIEGNHAKSMINRVDVFAPFRHTIHNLDMKIIINENLTVDRDELEEVLDIILEKFELVKMILDSSPSFASFQEEIKTEISEKVKERTYASYGYGRGWNYKPPVNGKLSTQDDEEEIEEIGKKKSSLGNSEEDSKSFGSRPASNFTDIGKLFGFGKDGGRVQTPEDGPVGGGDSEEPISVHAATEEEWEKSQGGFYVPTRTKGGKPN